MWRRKYRGVRPVPCALAISQWSMLPTGVTPSSSLRSCVTLNKFSGTRLVWWGLTIRYCLSMAWHFAARRQLTAHAQITCTFHLAICSSTRTVPSNSSGYAAVSVDQSTWHTATSLLTHVPSTWSQLRATDVHKHRHCTYIDGLHSQEVGGLWFETQVAALRALQKHTLLYLKKNP